jgi:hypothetical protein
MTELPLGAPIASFVVRGQPAPQGSKKAFPIYRGSGADRVFTGRTSVVEQLNERIKTWRTSVVNAAQRVVFCDCGDPHCRAMVDGFPFDEPLIARMVFSFARPKSHYRSGKWAHLLKDSAPMRPSAPPDVSKLARSTEDALKDVGFYKDDARIVDYARLAKVWCREDPEALPTPGAVLSFWRLPPGEVMPPRITDLDQLSLDSLLGSD